MFVEQEDCAPKDRRISIGVLRDDDVESPWRIAPRPQRTHVRRRGVFFFAKNAGVDITVPILYDSFAMIILLHGDDTYRSHKRLQQLRDAFRAKHDPSGLNVLTLDGATLEAEQFHEQAAAQGFLAAKRFLAVRGLLAEGKAATQEAVAASLAQQDGGADTILVFWEPADASELKLRAKTSDALRSLLLRQRNERFDLLDPAGVQQWVLREVEWRGGTIEKKAAVRLATSLGTDLWRGVQEIEKLVHWKGGGLITETDIDQLVTEGVDDNIFRLTDALGARDCATALRVLEEQFVLGTEPLVVLRTLAWHIRNILGARALLDRGTQTPATIARELGLHPFVAQKAVRQAAAFTLDELIRLHDDLCAADEQLKTRRVSARALFDLLALSATR